MCSIEEAWGRAAAPEMNQSRGSMVGQNFYNGINRNDDPRMPYVNHGSAGNREMQLQPQSDQQQAWAQLPPQQQQAAPQISVHVEKSPEERELYQYLRSHLGEMNVEKIHRYFKNKCKSKVRKASAKCGCVGVSEHMEQCQNCRGMCHRRGEFRANLTLILLVGVFILLALNLLFPRGGRK